ncbi:MAG: hypothetical protein IJL26_09655 [Clostridia bacterium]|nr:hypothetical protein [Clostridia bacterium]
MRNNERVVSARVVRLREIACGVYRATAPRAALYEGAYAVAPDFTAQTLPTRGKNMADDVTVEAIRVSRTKNLSGGNTVFIGGQING